LTLDNSFYAEKIEIVRSLDELDNLLKKTSRPEEENFIIGGGMIYKLFIDKADKLYITHVEAEFPDADTYFPVIDQKIWQKTKSRTMQKDALNKYNLEFAEYVKKI
jgi:dihydrofolate reductase